MISATIIWLVILAVLISGLILSFVLGLVLNAFKKPDEVEFCFTITEVIGTVFDVVFMGGIIIGLIWYYLF